MTFPIPILLYHSVSETGSPQFREWTIHPKDFDKHLHYLRQQQFTPMTITDLVTAIDSGTLQPSQRPVAITFDDGFVDFYANALPVLQKHECAATIYIVTEYVGATSRWLSREGEGDKPMMSWDQIGELDAAGIECGAHTRTHPQLDLIPVDRARDEITRSKAELEHHLGKPVTSFAYPHGHYDRVVRKLVIEAGFSSACGVKHAMSAPHDDRYSLGRIMIKRDTSVHDLKALLTSEELPVAQTQERLRTTLWRVVRRAKHKVRPAF